MQKYEYIHIYIFIIPWHLMIYNFSSVSRLVHIAEGWGVIATSNVSFIVAGLKLLLIFFLFFFQVC